jgi:hypothetical protein
MQRQYRSVVTVKDQTTEVITYHLLLCLYFKQTLEKTEGEIENVQSRETGNIWHTRHRTKTSKAKNTTQHRKVLPDCSIYMSKAVGVLCEQELLTILGYLG